MCIFKMTTEATISDIPQSLAENLVLRFIGRDGYLFKLRAFWFFVLEIHRYQSHFYDDYM